MQRNEPSVRVSFVSRRVSMPSIATMPCSVSHSSNVEFARWLLEIAESSLITNASGQARALSSSSFAMP